MKPDLRISIKDFHAVICASAVESRWNSFGTGDFARVLNLNLTLNRNLGLSLGRLRLGLRLRLRGERITPSRMPTADHLSSAELSRHHKHGMHKPRVNRFSLRRRAEFAGDALGYHILRPHEYHETVLAQRAKRVIATCLRRFRRVAAPP